MRSPSDRYLDLLKLCLTDLIRGSVVETTFPIEDYLRPEIVKACQEQGVSVVQKKPFDVAVRTDGRDWPSTGETMMGLIRLNNLQHCVAEVLRHNIPGDFIETGVWRGGGTIFMKAMLECHGDTRRTVWVADSFQGLPPPNVEKYPQDAGIDLFKFRELAISVEQVKANFAKYGLLDERVRFLKGWFRDTLPTAPIEKLAVIRLDGDLYESTIQALDALYPKLSAGGYVIVDDYGAIEACKQAVHDFRKQHGIHDPIIPVDWTGVYWQRSASEGAMPASRAG